MSAPTLKIGLAGFGNVGAGVYRNLEKNRKLLCERTGYHLEISRIAVRNREKSRLAEAPTELFTENLSDLLDDAEISIIVELIGGTDQAFDLIKGALERGKSVVTGNKALLAERGRELFAIAEACDRPIHYEAAVAGGIPIIKAMQESLIANHIQSVTGIINGTCNYILTRMFEAGLSYETALAEAQELGYAEADPALDISGWDAAHKAIILASLSYGRWVPCDQIHVEGIENIRSEDVNFAATLGYVIKLLGVIRLHPETRSIELRVQPSLLPIRHLLASVKGVFNAVAVQGDLVGETIFYGSGAGSDPTSSSVIADIADAAMWTRPNPGSGLVTHSLYGDTLPIGDSISKYYLRVDAEDRPGVLARIAAVLGENEIGILSVIQPEEHEADTAPIVLMLHYAPYRRILTALDQIALLDCVRGRPILMRVEDVG